MKIEVDVMELDDIALGLETINDNLTELNKNIEKIIQLKKNKRK